MEQNFDKAIHNPGDVHPKNSNLVWTEYQPGKFDWRKRKNGNKTQPEVQSQAQAVSVQSSERSTQSQVQPKTSLDVPFNTNGVQGLAITQIADLAEKQSTKTLQDVVNNKKEDIVLRQVAFNQLKTRKDYDSSKVDSSDLNGGITPKPKAKVQYQTKKPIVDVVMPETWIIRGKDISGNTVNKKVTASTLRKFYASKDDADLLKILNNSNGTWQNRQIAYDEAAHRGIDEENIDVSGTLQDKWKKDKRRHDEIERLKNADNPEEQVAIDPDELFGGYDHEKFMSQFSEGDYGWTDKRDPRVQKEFNDFKTITDRQNYDNILTYYGPTAPGYMSIDGKVGDLNEQYANLLQYGNTPLFISAGGAGAGKSYGWRVMAEEYGCEELKPGDDPQGDNAWGWTMCSDVSDEEELRKTLAKYNGTYTDYGTGEQKPHILVFDDADKILTSNSKPMRALMKKITDNNPANRIFINPSTQQPEVFKGAIVVMTNKDIDLMCSRDEDLKAICSRGTVNNIQATRAESMDLIKRRYQTIHFGDFDKSFKKLFPTEKEQHDARQKVYDWLEDHMKEADPAKFTPRLFVQAMSKVGVKLAKGSSVKNIRGVRVGSGLSWEDDLRVMIKAGEDELEKGEHYDNRPEVIEQIAADKKRYGALCNNEAIDKYFFGITVTDDPEDEDSNNKNEDEEDKNTESEDIKDVQKAIDSMTLDEAEEILFG